MFTAILQKFIPNAILLLQARMMEQNQALYSKNIRMDLIRTTKINI
jgi:hypothetical protein